MGRAIEYKRGGGQQLNLHQKQIRLGCLSKKPQSHTNNVLNYKNMTRTGNLWALKMGILYMNQRPILESVGIWVKKLLRIRFFSPK